MDDPDLIALRDEALASCEGFNKKDVAAWMDPVHEDAVTYNGAFVPIAAIRPVADALIQTFNSFMIDNVDGRIVDDTAILFGDYEVETAEGDTTRGVFTFTYVRTNGEWKTLLSHYTPSGG